MKPKRVARWERRRARGFWWYVQSREVLGWSLPGALWGLIEAVVWHGSVVTHVLLWFVLSTAVGIPYHVAVWFWSERRYA